MRLLFAGFLIFVLALLVGFVLADPGQRVTLTFGSKQFTDVALPIVLLVALTLGVAFTGVIALFEGAIIRLENRRLRKQLERIETENSFLRSQSGSIPPDDPPFYADGGDPDEELYDEPRQRPLARAPVYDPDGPGPGSG